MPSKKKILVVEDDVELSDFMVRTLEFQNYEVATAWSGEKALVEAQKVPDLILLDISLEGIGGLKVLELVRNDPKTSEIPVVMCSSANFPANKAKARELGADGFLTKPFKLDDFTATVDRLLGIQSA
ncbi:MAG: response regulator transcription factor [Elusimicrobiota bacterium]